jgi:hypothetical protein
MIRTCGELMRGSHERLYFFTEHRVEFAETSDQFAETSDYLSEYSDKFSGYKRRVLHNASLNLANHKFGRVSSCVLTLCENG